MSKPVQPSKDIDQDMLSEICKTEVATDTIFHLHNLFSCYRKGNFYCMYTDSNLKVEQFSPIKQKIEFFSS